MSSGTMKWMRRLRADPTLRRATSAIGLIRKLCMIPDGSWFLTPKTATRYDQERANVIASIRRLGKGVIPVLFILAAETEFANECGEALGAFGAAVVPDLIDVVEREGVGFLDPDPRESLVRTRLAEAARVALVRIGLLDPILKAYRRRNQGIFTRTELASTAAAIDPGDARVCAATREILQELPKHNVSGAIFVLRLPSTLSVARLVATVLRDAPGDRALEDAAIQKLRDVARSSGRADVYKITCDLAQVLSGPIRERLMRLGREVKKGLSAQELLAAVVGGAHD